MFLAAAQYGCGGHCFPRVCGDVPHYSPGRPGPIKFSPRMRGCSSRRRAVRSKATVFPAYAGMFLRPVSSASTGPCFPRVCGDVPDYRRDRAVAITFSPRMRGCSSQNRLSISLPPVFPAYAGMFLGLSSEGSSTACFPRVCGDVPVRTTVRAAAAPFSPRMRGCSPALLLALSVSLRFPRVCGDVPSGSSLQSGAVKFSPRMRGCSQLHRPIPRSHHVFPAYAGMFPRLSFKPIWVGSFPRIRGDVPTRGFTEAARAAFSPHTRGCSEEDLEQAQCHLVFPAYARMFPTWATTTGTWKGFPRIRGDVSMFERHGLELAVFSPHTRGCSWLPLWFPFL